MCVKLIFIQGPHTEQFDLMWAGSLKRWKEIRREGRKEGNKKGRKERHAKGRREER